MKTKSLPILLFALLLAFSTIAQDYAFKVLVIKGTNELKTGDAWQPIKTGASLKSGDELKLSDNSYIGLMHVTGKPIELKQAGSYKVADLSSKISGGSSVLNKYTDFILSSNSTEAKKNRLSATGAVHRGEATAIQILLPENQHADIYNSSVAISWEASKVEGPYIVVINNMFGEELAKIETPESSIRVDLSDAKYATENAVLVQVAAKADPNKKSAEKLIKKLTQPQKDKIKISLGEIQNNVSEQTALNKLLLAGFYEEHHLYIDAVAAYEDAIRLAPDVAFYKESYDDFLIRNGMKR
ncbi:hypothetical protein [Ohtaekwangia koreensis]|uniref:Tetratricopeptide repeat-containing protein n=1 Tax=Ohtaekwangia koreensis TaxID=688867 RepID=A0A1T5IM83_9BACT|nr:hypothetical protein [Ohtaekwangia koreensis]SKC40230.1 hypothetical protein SAMN05660236_0165 [Ohtaekwangia koreensis]